MILRDFAFPATVFVLAPVLSFVNVSSFDKFFSIKAALAEGMGGETVLGIGPKRELVRIFLSERFLRNATMGC